MLQQTTIPLKTSVLNFNYLNQHYKVKKSMYVYYITIIMIIKHDQFMGVNTISLPFPSCLPAFYVLAIHVTCYISITCLHCFFFITTVM